MTWVMQLLWQAAFDIYIHMHTENFPVLSKHYTLAKPPFYLFTAWREVNLCQFRRKAPQAIFKE